METDYGEIICSAVDAIVTARLQGLQYDITKLCTVVDASMSYQGKYIVSDGTARYEACSTDVSFKNGNQVLVNIPNGDYSMQKTIVGRVASDDTTPFNYTPPLDSIIKITSNVLADSRMIYGDNSGLLANGDIKLIGPIYSVEGNQELDGYTRLGLSANFRSWLSGLDVASGSYGIKVLVYTNMVQESGQAAANTVYELNFSSADMIGNPYQFEDYFYQEKVFDISNISNVQKLEVYFYQDSNFLNGDSKKIAHQIEDNLSGELIDKPNNLFVKDVCMYLGYEIGTFTDETLILHTPDDLTYRYDKTEAKEINLRWIHKIDETNYEILNEKNFDDQFEIHWFKYNPGYEIIDQYAGKDWEEIQTGSFDYHLVPEAKNQSEKIKVVGLIKSAEIKNGIQTATPYFSNILVFENEELVPDQATLKASTALSIRCADNSEGNYLLYDQNGKIINEGLGKGFVRQLRVMYQGAEVTEETIENIGTINWIKWYFPIENNTMLITTNEMYEENDGEKSTTYFHYRGTNYIGVVREKKEGTKMPNLTQSYSIGNMWSAQNNNNIVICRVSINGVEYEALEELHFGKAGSNGTDTTFFIEFVGNDNALIAGSDKSAEVRARLYLGANAAAANGIPAGVKVNWEWHKGADTYAEYKVNEADTSYCILKCKTDTVPTDNYMILKASIKIEDNPTLEAYLPIPIKSERCAYMEGAREVIYNHQGNPSYYDGAYVAYIRKEGADSYDEIKDWSLTYSENLSREYLTTSYIPILKQMTVRSGYKALSASPFYASGYNDEICVSCSDWSQPLLIMQSKYDLAMLNEWDGKLTLDEDNGTILSTMLGAGRKNEDNTFSGVLIGDVREGTDNEATDAQTGIYGLHEGVISYALKEDGTAIFGKKGKGQIKIDGNSGSIKSGNYDESATGMCIDLDQGILDIKADGKERIKITPNLNEEDLEKPYFLVNSADEVPLISVGSEDYFLQSNNYGREDIGTGLSLDLANGTLLIDGGASSGQIELSGDPDKNLFKVVVDSGINTLIEMNSQNYYLQSRGFSGTSIKTITYHSEEYKMYTNKNTSFNNGTSKENFSSEIGLKDGKVYSYDSGVFTLKTFYETTFTVERELGEYEDANYTEDIEMHYTADQNKIRFISQLIPIYTNINPSGLRIDLNNGIIQGYNLYLKGIKTGVEDSLSFTLDSSAEEYPIMVGNNFKIGWNGDLYCNNVTSLNNDGRNDMAISIGNNFYVTSSGGAGGTTWQGSSTGVAGYKATSITLDDGSTIVVWKKTS